MSQSETDSNQVHPKSFMDINLRAAEKSKSLSAFSDALKYAINGTTLVQQDPWKVSYIASLRLHSVGAETAASLGHVETLDKIANGVLPRDDVSTLDKLRVYTKV